MKNSSQTQHHRSETKKKEEQEMEEIAGCRVQAGSREQGNSSRWKPMEQDAEQLISLWHSENFEILAKFRYGHILAMIAKIRYHSENSNFRYACYFRYDSEIHYA